MNDKEKRLVDILTITGFKLVGILPVIEFGFELSMQQFRDSIRLRHGWENMHSTNILSLR